MSCRIRFGDAYRVPKNADKAEEIRKLRDKMAELRWNFYERQEITQRADLDIGKMRDEILLAVNEYPPLDWEYEKTVIFRQTASQ